MNKKIIDMKKKIKCPECGKLLDDIIEITTNAYTLEHKEGEYQYNDELTEIEHRFYICPECNAELLDELVEDKIQVVW